MKKKSAWFGLIGLFLTAVLLGAFFQSGEDLFQKALRLERNEGKLMEAIVLYNKVVAEKGNESLAAQAQLRIGLCYEKLGQKNIEQAQDAFQKVLDNFPSQTEAVRLAKEKLLRIVQVNSATKNREVGLKILKIKSDRMVDEYASISPDGHYISFVDWETGDLAVFDMEKGEKRRLTDKGDWKESFEMALNSRWSPDGKKIVYAWIGKDSRDLRIIGLNNLDPRILVRSPYADKEAYKETDCRDWSPDGTQILALVRKGSSKQIVSISVEDGSFQIIKTLHKAWPINLRYSPDGRSIAYDYPVREGSPERDIFLISANGEKEMKLVEHPADDFFLGFLPDGKHFLFASDRSGARDVWTAEFDGKSNLGTPELVKSNIGNIAPLGITQKGTFCYIHLRSFFDVYSAEVDPERGELIAPPKKLIKYHEGMNDWPDFSPDGKHIAYLSRRNIREARRTPRAAGSVICVYSSENGEIKEISTKLNVYGPPRWSPDGSSILINGAYDDDSVGIYAIEVQTGEGLPIVIDGAVQNSYDWSVDGRSIFYVRNNKKEKFCEILAKNLESGQEKKLYRENEDVSFAISRSPDGKWLAILDNAGRKQRELRVLPVSGGEPKKLYTFEQLTGHGLAPVWSADGKFVLLPNNQPPQEGESDGKKGGVTLWPWFLFCIPVDGGEPHAIDLGVHLLFRPRIHPDGRHVAFGSWGNIEDFTIRAIRATGVWMMENILPKK